MNDSEALELVTRLVQLPSETEWVEFKKNNKDPERVGRTLSALANSAALCGRGSGYIVWGIEDRTHDIVGTSFQPKTFKLGAQALENWLATQLEPRVAFTIHELNCDGKHVAVIAITAASHTPVAFKGVEYIRVSNHNQPLSRFAGKRRALWQVLSRDTFETAAAATGLSSMEALRLLDWEAFLELAPDPSPKGYDEIIDRLLAERLIRRGADGNFDISNLGALLFARRLADFGGLERKAVRVIFYKGTNRTETQVEHQGRKGYAAGFGPLLSYISDRLPASEEIKRHFRVDTTLYPPIAVRELVANALIHQDLNASGIAPRIEVFEDRIEIINPGMSLVDPERFLDQPPQWRNDALAAMMHKLTICEERGSGIDKVVFQSEVFQLPPPEFSIDGNHTKAVLYAPRKFSRMSREEKLRACYLHASLRWVSGNKPLTNSSLRNRFGLSKSGQATTSRIIADAVASGLIRPVDPESRSKRHAQYQPFWAN